MTQKESFKDITSEEYLDKALETAKRWCKENLPKSFNEFNDFKFFHYTIDNDMIADMRIDDNRLIRVSTKTLKWYQKRENYFEENGMIRYARIGGEEKTVKGGVEVDPESMFVHEITEWIILDKVGLLNLSEYSLGSISNAVGAHSIAYEMENINRRERGLKYWPELG